MQKEYFKTHSRELFYYETVPARGRSKKHIIIVQVSNGKKYELIEFEKDNKFKI